MRWKLFRVAAIAGVAVVALLVFIRGGVSHRPIVKAYFANAMGLRPGAPVRLAGVDIGSVKSVRARPELKDGPAEVIMVLNSSSEPKIPNDSTVQLETAGILGETYVDIDATTAYGPPIGADAVLKSKPTAPLNLQQVLENFTESLHPKNCDCEPKTDSASAPTTAKKSPTKNPSR